MAKERLGIKKNVLKIEGKSALIFFSGRATRKLHFMVVCTSCRMLMDIVGDLPIYLCTMLEILLLLIKKKFTNSLKITFLTV